MTYLNQFGTNPQQVRQDIQQDLNNSQQFGNFGGANQAQFGAQSVFQQGFAGTNPQQVRQDISQEAGRSQFGQPNQQQFSNQSSFNNFGGANQAQFSGAQSVFQPGFAGTNPQQVRQDISQEAGRSQFGFTQ
jgi:hypothetical protein